MLRGDGIGPELVDSATCTLDAINDNSSVKFSLVHVEAGDGALTRYNNALPDFTLSSYPQIGCMFEGTGR